MSAGPTRPDHVIGGSSDDLSAFRRSLDLAPAFPVPTFLATGSRSFDPTAPTTSITASAFGPSIMMSPTTTTTTQTQAHTSANSSSFGVSSLLRASTTATTAASPIPIANPTGTPIAAPNVVDLLFSPTKSTSTPSTGLRMSDLVDNDDRDGFGPGSANASSASGKRNRLSTASPAVSLSSVDLHDRDDDEFADLHVPATAVVDEWAMLSRRPRSNPPVASGIPQGPGGERAGMDSEYSINPNSNQFANRLSRDVETGGESSGRPATASAAAPDHRHHHVNFQDDCDTGIHDAAHQSETMDGDAPLMFRSSAQSITLQSSYLGQVQTPGSAPNSSARRARSNLANLSSMSSTSITATSDVHRALFVDDEETAQLREALTRREALTEAEQALLAERRAKKRHARRRQMWALICVLIMVGSFETIAQISQALQTKETTPYNKPFFSTYLVIVSFSIFYFGWLIRRLLTPRSRRPRSRSSFSTRKWVILSVGFSFLYFTGCVFWFFSIPRTTVAANLIIYQSLPAVVFILSIVLLREHGSLVKFLAVALSFLGVVIIAVADIQATAANNPDGSSSDPNLNPNPNPIHNGTLLPSINGSSSSLSSLASVGRLSVAALAQVPGSASISLGTMVRWGDIGSEPPENGISTTSIDDTRERESNEYSVNEFVGGFDLLSLSSSPNDTRKTNTTADGRHSTALGFVATCVAVMGSAFFQVLTKKYAQDPSSDSDAWHSARLLGSIGVVSTFLWMPTLPIVHYIGLERFEFPSALQWRSLLLTAFVDDLYVIAMLIGVAMSSPLFVSIGSMLLIPVSIIVDHFLHDYHLRPFTVIGITLIVAGFLGIQFSSPLSRWMFRNCRCIVHCVPERYRSYVFYDESTQDPVVEVVRQNAEGTELSSIVLADGNGSGIGGDGGDSSVGNNHHRDDDGADGDNFDLRSESSGVVVGDSRKSEIGNRHSGPDSSIASGGGGSIEMQLLGDSGSNRKHLSSSD